MQVLLLEESVRAHVAIRFAVSPAVVRDHVEPAPAESLDDAGAARPVVGDTVQIHDGAAARAGCAAPPAFQADASSSERRLLARRRRGLRDSMTGRMQQ